MKIEVVENAGFCFGVKRATELAFKATTQQRSQIYTLGPLIHNPQVVEQLESKGVRVVYNIDQLPQNEFTLIIRSHGIQPQILDRIKSQAKNCQIVDATCPFVKKAQQIAQKLLKENYQLIIVGDRKHPEVASIVGHDEHRVLVVENEKEIDLALISDKVGLLTQTTRPLDYLQKVANYLLPNTKELRIFKTICDFTQIRQKTTLELARKVDAMIVVGGRNSANTSQLVTLSKKAKTPTFWVETAQEIKKESFQEIKKIGVTSGASTPLWIVEEIIEKLKEIAKNNN